MRVNAKHAYGAESTARSLGDREAEAGEGCEWGDELAADDGPGCLLDVADCSVEGLDFEWASAGDEPAKSSTSTGRAASGRALRVVEAAGPALAGEAGERGGTRWVARHRPAGRGGAALPATRSESRYLVLRDDHLTTAAGLADARTAPAEGATASRRSWAGVGAAIRAWLVCELYGAGPDGVWRAPLRASAEWLADRCERLSVSTLERPATRERLARLVRLGERSGVLHAAPRRAARLHYHQVSRATVRRLVDHAPDAVLRLVVVLWRVLASARRRGASGATLTIVQACAQSGLSRESAVQALRWLRSRGFIRDNRPQRAPLVMTAEGWRLPARVIEVGSLLAPASAALAEVVSLDAARAAAGSAGRAAGSFDTDCGLQIEDAALAPAIAGRGEPAAPGAGAPASVQGAERSPAASGMVGWCPSATAEGSAPLAPAEAGESAESSSGASSDRAASGGLSGKVVAEGLALALAESRAEVAELGATRPPRSRSARAQRAADCRTIARIVGTWAVLRVVLEVERPALARASSPVRYLAELLSARESAGELGGLDRGRYRASAAAEALAVGGPSEVARRARAERAAREADEARAVELEGELAARPEWAAALSRAEGLYARAAAAVGEVATGRASAAEVEALAGACRRELEGVPSELGPWARLCEQAAEDAARVEARRRSVAQVEAVASVDAAPARAPREVALSALAELRARLARR